MNKNNIVSLSELGVPKVADGGSFFISSGDIMGEMLNPALLQAALKVKVFQTIQELINRNENLDQISIHGYSPLMSASMTGCIQGVKALLSAGADVNLVNKKGQTALFLASSNGHTDIVRVLAKAGADLNLADKKEGKTPLMVASEFGHIPVVSALIRAGAEVNYTSDFGQTALSYAIFGFSRDVKVVKKLIEAGAEIQAEPKGRERVYALKPLVLAVLHRNLPAAKVLLEAGASGKDVALKFAQERGQLDMQSMLEGHSCAKRIRSNKGQKTQRGIDRSRS